MIANELLNDLYRRIGGDFKTPNMFFVRLSGNVQMVTTDFNAAYKFWTTLADSHYTAQPDLCDRIYGTICAVEKGLFQAQPDAYTRVDAASEYLKMCIRENLLIENGA